MRVGIMLLSTNPIFRQLMRQGREIAKAIANGNTTFMRLCGWPSRLYTSGTAPGEELRELSMSAAELARRLDVPTNRVTSILSGRRAITGELPTLKRLKSYTKVGFVPGPGALSRHIAVRKEQVAHVKAVNTRLNRCHCRSDKDP
jgi:hypothetical protein